MEEAGSSGTQGLIAVVAAVALVAFAWTAGMRLAAASTTALIAQWAAGGGVIVLVTRAPLHRFLRLGLVLAVIGTLFVLSLAGDMLLSERTREALARAERAGGDAARSPTTADATARGGDSAARIALTPSPRGDAGWAAILTRAYAGRIVAPGGAAVAISGEVAARDAGTVALRWSAGMAGVTLDCGTGSATGADRDAVIAAIRPPLEQAVRRSAALGRASCP